MKKNWKRVTALFLSAIMTCNTLGGGISAMGKGLDSRAQAFESVHKMSKGIRKASPADASPSNGVKASPSSGVKASPSDGIYPDAATDDTWTGNGKGTVTVEDGWLHLKSSSGDNGTNQFYVVNDNAVISKDGTGFVEFTVKFNSGLGDTRFGVYLFSGGPLLGEFVGYDSGSKWFWQTYSGGNPYGGLNLSSAVSTESKVRIDYEDGQARVKVNGVLSDKKIDLSKLAEDNTGLAFKAAQWNTTSTDVMLKDIHYTGQTLLNVHKASGAVKDKDGKPIKSAILKTDEGMTAVTDSKGEFSDLKMSPGTHAVTVSAAGCVTITQEVEMGEEDQSGFDFVLETAPVIQIESASMTVELYENFPAVRQYVLKGEGLEGEVVQGSFDSASVIRLNNKDITLSKEQVECQLSGDKAVYTLSIPESDGVADCAITVEVSVENNILTMEIPQVEYKKDRTAENAIQSIRFPGQSLVAVSSTENGTFAGSNMSSHAMISGDTFQNISDMEAGSKDWMYAFVSGEKVSATVESNSEATGEVVYSYGIGGGSNNTRLTATTLKREDGSKVTGIGSNIFYWNRVEHAKSGNGDPLNTMDYITEPTEKPLVKVIITGDRNDDTRVDWQDGAIAFREISHEIYGSQEVPDRVAMRIVENFSSQATNPFLMSLDNAKKVYLNTDGLGQSILFKGYANEGHDSAHPDYYDINKRAGGVEDFKAMLAGGAEIGARFGIHVNASEMYPEAKAFDEELVKRGSNGGLSFGWNWLDQGVGIDSRFDLVSGRRAERFNKLHEELGGDGGDQLDFVYVDVWGNGTGTLEDSWATRRLTDEITNNGWRMATEWGMANEYDSTFQHWAVDLNYGNQTNKGYNSTIARFIRNHQKDAWVADYPEAFGGASNAPLLGGYNQLDFEGWSGRNNYDKYMTNMFTYDISTKFLQHFTVDQWKLDPANPKTITDKKGTQHTWIPDSMIHMKGNAGEVVITRGSTDYSIAVDSDYRDRTITLDGKEILRGHLTQADTGEKGDETYLIPWFWNTDGSELAENDQKLYHWNTQGGETTWELPNGWDGLGSVSVYRLTSEGKTERTEVPVSGGQITLNAEAETPYVVYQGEAEPLDITWEGSHLYDTGFNSANLDKWNISGNASIYNTSYGNPVLRMEGESGADQTITDLVPGTRYALYLALDNQSDADFAMTVTGKDGKALGSRHVGQSIAKNYVATDPHNSNYAMEDGTNGYTQYAYVWFTPDDVTAVLHLDRMAGTGSTYIDNLRVVENEEDDTIYDENGEMVSYKQDFEHVVQGLYPFVMGGATGITDTRVHLSELHAPYTQAGWDDVKRGSDVLDGNWSLKANGQTQKRNLVYQTVPQNLYFKPGYTYKISFDYQVGSDGTYGVVIGDGEQYSTADIKLLSHVQDADKNFVTENFEFEITGAADGQTWFGLYSTSTAADLQGAQGSARDFGGYMDLILDNLKVERADQAYETRESLQALIHEAETKYQESSYSPEIWAKYRMALAQAKAVLAKDVPATDSQITGAYNLLKAYMFELDHYKGVSADFAGADISVEGMVATAGSYHAGEGPDRVLDGDETNNAMWHTGWGENTLNDTNNWLMLELPEPTDVDGIRYLPRAGGGNGNILEMKALVSTDGTTWVPVTALDGSDSFTFEKNDSWKKSSFQTQENVKFVKITAIKTDGTREGEANKFVSAREVRLTNSALYTPKPLPVDTAALTYMIGQAEGFTENYYTPQTWKVLTEKLEAAKAAVKSNDYDVAALALANLYDAISNLEIRPDVPDAVDKSELKAAVEEYSKLMQGNYTDESWKLFRTALSEARSILGDEKATAADVEKTLIALRAAKANLVENPDAPETVDKTGLQNLINQCLEIQKGTYTDDSWMAFQEALTAANTVLADKNATKADVEQVYANLEAAKRSLTKNPSNGSGSGSSGSGSHSAGAPVANSYPVLKGNYPSSEATGTWSKDSSSSWKFKKSDGANAKNEWLKINGVWYLFGEKEILLTNWVEVNGLWYYLDSTNGDMKTGWIMLAGNWYYLKPSGEMLVSATSPDGFNVDASGAWVK